MTVALSMNEQFQLEVPFQKTKGHFDRFETKMRITAPNYLIAVN